MATTGQGEGKQDTHWDSGMRCLAADTAGWGSPSLQRHVPQFKCQARATHRGNVVAPAVCWQACTSWINSEGNSLKSTRMPSAFLSVWNSFSLTVMDSTASAVLSSVSSMRRMASRRAPSWAAGETRRETRLRPWPAQQHHALVIPAALE